MDVFDYREELKKIPHRPGVYQYFDKNNELIYIGKAKDLRNRVGSYFVSENQLNGKTRVLVRKINRISFTIVDTEIDAWLLENSLIKKHKPKYNVLLKDDKTYPWIVIKNEPFPRVFWTRQYIKDGSRYYGPYPSVGMMHIVLDLIRELFPLRTCNLALTQENKDILNGKIAMVTNRLKEGITTAAAALDFERAQLIKAKLDKLDNYQSKSTVVNSSITNVDVFSIASDEGYAFVNYLKVMNGVIIQTQTLEMKRRLDESEQELLALAIPEIRDRFKSLSREIIVPFELDIEENERIRFTIPKLGEKKKLLELSQKNVAFFRKERLLQYEKLNPDIRTERILKQMQKDLRMNVLPQHIECFDNSNIQGNYPVSAIVVFKDAKPSKKDYRHFNVKTVEGPNDFATMEEAVFRRYRRLLDEDQPLPQLIIIDGGKGQLGAALKSLRLLGIERKVTVIGIAKRLEELFYPGDQYPLYLDKKSETLKVIQHLRDEAHRFGITFHRNQRSRKTFVSELENVPGIGKTTVEKVLTEFKSVKKVKEASDEDLKKVLNLKQIKALREYFAK